MGMLRGVRHTEELYKFSRKNEALEKLTILFIFSYSNFNIIFDSIQFLLTKKRFYPSVHVLRVQAGVSSPLFEFLRIVSNVLREFVIGRQQKKNIWSAHSA